MGIAYYGSKISPHIVRNPAGFLICKDVPIARTGTQQYLAREIGIPERGNDIVKVYRLDEDVFNQKAIASFNGAPFTNEHPNDWVQPQNVLGLVKGTVTNVRRGTGSDSDLLLADVIIYGKQEIEEVEAKEKREISCGYECEYVPYKDGYKQIGIIGNHVALVSAGRAGERVAIKDTAENANKFSKIVKDERSKRMGYRIPRKSSITDFVNAVGLKTLAADAEPEEVQEMVEGLVDEKKKAECVNEPIVIEPQAEDSVTDEDLEEVREQISEVKDAIYAILSRDEEAVDPEENEDEDEGLEAFDALEDEFKEVEDEDLLEEVEEVDVPADEINEKKEEILDDDCEEEECEEELTTDSILELARVLKPVVASIKNASQRKQVSDNLTAVLRKHANKVKDSNAKKSNYAKMVERAKDSEPSEATIDFGMEIAKKNNPHYKEVK